MTYSDYNFGGSFHRQMKTNELIVNDNAGTFKPSDNPTIPTASGTAGVSYGLDVDNRLLTRDVPLKKAVFTLTDVEISMPVSTDAWGSIALANIPDGLHYIFGAKTDFTAEAGAGAINDDADLLSSLGTTATADATLDSTDADILAADTQTLSSGSGDVAAQSASPVGFITGSSTSLYLNLAVAAADLTGTTTDTLTLNGTIELYYFDLTV